MPSDLLGLPLEIQWCIVNEFEVLYFGNTLRNLSLSCRFFHMLLTPKTMQQAFLKNTVKSGKSVAAIAAGPRRTLVKELRYRAQVPGLHKDENGSQESAQIFPAVVKKVLSRLHRFSKLEEVSFEFSHPYKYEGQDGVTCPSWNDLENEETASDVLAAERSQSWRDLMAKSYEAISRNRKAGFWFEIRSLVPKEVSTFNSPVFHAFLARLTGFEISIYGVCEEDLPAGYQSFVNRLDEFFLNHLNSAAHLSISTNGRGGPLGWQEDSDMRLSSSRALLAPPMPFLSSVHFLGICICQDLADFLTARADTLETVILEYCIASENSFVAGDGMSWAEFFDIIYEAKPSKLRELVVGPPDDEVAMVSNQFLSHPMPTQSDIEAAERVQKALETDPTLRAFEYMSHDARYNEMEQDPEESLRAFQLGHDRRAWARLTRLMKINNGEISPERVWDQIMPCNDDGSGSQGSMKAGDPDTEEVA